MKITQSQNKYMYQLFHQSEETAYRDEYVHFATNGRETSCAQLNTHEAQYVITMLNYVLQGKQKPLNPNSKLYKNFSASPVNSAEIPSNITPEQRSNNLRRKILAYCHKLGWYARTPSNTILLKNGNPVLDYARIDAWCIKYSSQHKSLNKHSIDELGGHKGLVWQFKELTRNTIEK